jgi:hypothetical protein
MAVEERAQSTGNSGGESKPTAPPSNLAIAAAVAALLVWIGMSIYLISMSGMGLQFGRSGCICGRGPAIWIDRQPATSRTSGGEGEGEPEGC